MGEVGDVHAVQTAVGRVVDGLVEGVGADADGRPAEVVLADVDRVEGGVPGVPARGQDVGLGDRVVAQGVLGDIGLAVDDVLRPARSCGGDSRPQRTRSRLYPAILPKVETIGGLVAVADVVLLAVGQIGAVGLWGQRHLGRVDVGPVVPLRKAEGKDGPVLEQRGGPLLEGFVGAHPDGAEAENGDLPGVPVVKAVEGEDLVELAVAVRVPSAVIGRHRRWGSAEWRTASHPAGTPENPRTTPARGRAP